MLGGCGNNEPAGLQMLPGPLMLRDKCNLHMSDAEADPAAPARRPARPHAAPAACAMRRAGIGWALLAVALCSVVLPEAHAQQDAPTYKNITRVLHMLGDTWRGSGYDDNGKALYLFQPREDMTGECSPCTLSTAPRSMSLSARHGSAPVPSLQ